MKGSLRLSELPLGTPAIVGAIELPPARVDRLAALGILPGMEISVEQRTPVYVLRSDDSLLALEEELARGIVVHPGAGA
jgi:Fe2+ transport system protein FeoA